MINSSHPDNILRLIKKYIFLEKLRVEFKLIKNLIQFSYIIDIYIKIIHVSTLFLKLSLKIINGKIANCKSEMKYRDANRIKIKFVCKNTTMFRHANQAN